MLDVASGTGIVARLAAERMITGRVVGLDLYSGMLAVARTTPQNGGPRIDWHEASVVSIPFSGESFNVVLCQLGLQFFPDRPRALAEMCRSSLEADASRSGLHRDRTNADCACPGRCLGSASRAGSMLDQVIRALPFGRASA